MVSGTPVGAHDTTTGRSTPCLCRSCRGRLLGREHAEEEEAEDKDEDDAEDKGKDAEVKESWEEVQAAAALLVREVRSVGSALILKLPAWESTLQMGT